MDPEHDRVVLAVVVGREYVEEQAILVQGAVAELRQRLGTVAAELGRIDGPRRALGSLRRPPAQRPDRRGGIPNTKKLAHGADRIQRTLKRALGGRHQSWTAGLGNRARHQRAERRNSGQSSARSRECGTICGRTYLSFACHRFSSGNQFGTDNHAQPQRASAISTRARGGARAVPGPGTPRTGAEALRPPNAENRELLPTYEFIRQVREPILLKQPQQEMLADSTVDTHHVGGREVIDVQPSRLPNSPH